MTKPTNFEICFFEENKLNVLLSIKHHDAAKINAIDPLLQPWPPLGSYHVLARHKIPQPCTAIDDAIISHHSNFQIKTSRMDISPSPWNFLHSYRLQFRNVGDWSKCFVDSGMLRLFSRGLKIILKDFKKFNFSV